MVAFFLLLLWEGVVKKCLKTEGKESDGIKKVKDIPWKNWTSNGYLSKVGRRRGHRTI